MRQSTGQLTERLHLLRAEQLFTRLFEPKLRLALLGHVARDLGEADQLAVFVADGVEHCIRPEARTVLADAPSLGFVPPGLARGRERSLRDPRFAVLGRIE